MKTKDLRVRCNPDICPFWHKINPPCVDCYKYHNCLALEWHKALGDNNGH